MRILFCILITSALYCCAYNPPNNQNWAGYQRLSGEEILLAFNNVRDDAQVQDAAATIAVNHWHEKGTFVTLWTNQKQSGTVTGQWFVRNDTRCVIIESGLPSFDDEARCGPIYQRDDRYYTVNRDGTVHGIHALSKLPTPVE